MCYQAGSNINKLRFDLDASGTQFMMSQLFHYDQLHTPVNLHSIQQSRHKQQSYQINTRMYLTLLLVSQRLVLTLGKTQSSPSLILNLFLMSLVQISPSQPMYNSFFFLLLFTLSHFLYIRLPLIKRSEMLPQRLRKPFLLLQLSNLCVR